MKITTDMPDILVLRFTRWIGPLFWAVLTLFWLSCAALLVRFADVPMWMLFAWLAATVAWSLPMALLRVEKSMLILKSMTGEAELRHRTVFGMHQHRWPLHEVQSTRVTRYRNDGPATKDPQRMMTLCVRTGMDEGRHKLTNHTMPADDVLAASARVSDWMKDWRQRLDSYRPQP